MEKHRVMIVLSLLMHATWVLADSKRKVNREKKTPSFFIENNRGVKINLVNGKRVEFQNNTVDGESYRYYSFGKHYKDIEYVLVGEAYYEGAGFILVNLKNGNQYRIDNEPILSPNKTHLVTTSMDLEAEYFPNAIEIWRILKEGLQLEWSLEPKDWGPSKAFWKDNKTIILKKLSVENKVLASLQIVYRDNKWIFLDPSHKN